MSREVRGGCPVLQGPRPSRERRRRSGRRARGAPRGRAGASRRRRRPPPPTPPRGRAPARRRLRTAPGRPATPAACCERMFFARLNAAARASKSSRDSARTRCRAATRSRASRGSARARTVVPSALVGLKHGADLVGGKPRDLEHVLEPLEQELADATDGLVGGSLQVRPVALDRGSDEGLQVGPRFSKPRGARSRGASRMTPWPARRRPYGSRLPVGISSIPK